MENSRILQAHFELSFARFFGSCFPRELCGSVSTPEPHSNFNGIKLMKYSKLLIIAFVIVFPVFAYGQEAVPTPEPAPTPVIRADGCPVMPSGFACLTQAEMNAAAKAVRERDALQIELDAHKQALLDKDKIIENIKAVAAQNEADLREAVHNTEVELAAKTGEIVGIEAQNVQQRAIIEVLLKATRKKCLPFSICL